MIVLALLTAVVAAFSAWSFRRSCLHALKSGQRLTDIVQRERLESAEQRASIAEVEGFYAGWAACSDEMREREDTEKRRAAVARCPCPECVRRHLAAN